MGIHPSQSQAVPAPGGTTSDRNLVGAAVAGDREAFASLVERHHARILALLERLTGCHHQARDLAQETFVSAFRKLDSFAHQSEFSTWLHRIACNHAAAAARRRRPTVSLDAATATADGAVRAAEPSARLPEVSARLEQAELAERIAAALDKLDERYRAVVVLCDMQGATYEEIAETLDIPVGTVRSRLHRGRLELRQFVQPEWETT